MTEECKIVLSLIPYGLDKPIKAKEISKITGYSDSQVRNIIHTLVEKHHILIGASNVRGKCGYYMVSTEEEREKAANNLKSRIKAMSKRLFVLEHNDLKNNLDVNKSASKKHKYNVKLRGLSDIPPIKKSER